MPSLTSSASGIAYLVPYAAAILVPLALGLFTAARNRSKPVRTLCAFLYQESVWGLAIFLEVVSPTLAGKLFWDDVEFFTAGAVAVAALSFSLRFSGAWFKGGWRSYFSLMALPVAALAFAATDGWHGLMRGGARLDSGIPYGQLLYDFRWPGILVISPIYAISVASVAIVALLAVRQRGARRRGALVAALGLALPISGSVITVLGVAIGGRDDSSSLWLIAGNSLLAFAVLRYRVAGILPIARSVVVESLRDPILVLDYEGRTLDCNASLMRLLDPERGEVRGGAATELFPAWPAEARRVLEGRSDGAEFQAESEEGRRDFLLKAFPVLGGTGGRVIVIRDISALRLMERRLTLLNAELEQRVAERAEELIREADRRRAAEDRLVDLNEELTRTQREIMITLSEAVESRGRETARHVVRVAEFCRVLGTAAGFPAGEVELLAAAAPMHDIGKIGIPDSILRKPGALLPDETELMRRHTVIGRDILVRSSQPLFMAAAAISLDHHERWDGAGYPSGKAGEDISRDARIVAVCDVFDSLSASRSWKSGWALPEILEFFRNQRGLMFDPRLIDVFFLNIDKLIAAAAAHPDEPEIESFEEGGEP